MYVHVPVCVHMPMHDNTESTLLFWHLALTMNFVKHKHTCQCDKSNLSKQVSNKPMQNNDWPGLGKVASDLCSELNGSLMFNTSINKEQLKCKVNKA